MGVSAAILVTGDLAVFTPDFGPAIVVVRPGTLAGSGPARHSGKPVCVEGDESKVQVPGCSYVAGNFSTPGVGTLEIQRLADDQVSRGVQTGGKHVLRAHGEFVARFTVTVPATQPGPTPTPDATPSYTGRGQFTTTNLNARG